MTTILNIEVFVKEYLSKQPFKYNELAYLSLFILVSGIVLMTLIFGKTAFDSLAFKLLSEQLAPRAAELCCSIGVLYFTGYIAFNGPVTDYERIQHRVFIYISKFGLGSLFIYVSLMTASIISALILQYETPKPFTLDLIIPITVIAVFIAHFIYGLFAALMINSSNTKIKNFNFFRLICALLFTCVAVRAVLVVYVAVMTS